MEVERLAQNNVLPKLKVWKKYYSNISCGEVRFLFSNWSLYPSVCSKWERVCTPDNVIRWKSILTLFSAARVDNSVPQFVSFLPPKLWPFAARADDTVSLNQLGFYFRVIWYPSFLTAYLHPLEELQLSDCSFWKM